MPGIVLTLLTRPDTAEQILDVARMVMCLIHGKYLYSMVMRLEPHSAAQIIDEGPLDVAEKKIEDNEVVRALALKKKFEDWSHLHPEISKTRWIDDEGLPASVLRRRGQDARYIVVARPDWRADLVEYQAMFGAIFAAKKSVIVVPPDFSGGFGDVIAVAWRNDKSVWAVLGDVMEIFTEVKVIHLFSRERVVPSDLKDRIAKTLRGLKIQYHNIKADEELFPRLLLAKANALSVNLLVMGATAHSDWRILWLGHTTKYVLHYTDIPVIIRYDDDD